MHRPFLFVALAATTLTVSACRSIPDYSAWKQSNADVAEAVMTGFHTAASLNSDIATRLTNSPTAEKFTDESTRYKAIAEKLEKSSKAYDTLFGAIADYAASLDAIAKASADSQQTVDAVAGSLNNLVSAVGLTPLSGAGFELGKTVANELIKVKAAHDFAGAVAQADPAIGRVADILKADLADLAKAVAETKEAAIRSAFFEPHKAKREYRLALEARQAQLQRHLRETVETANHANATLPPTDAPATLLLSNTTATELAQIERMLNDTNNWYQPMNAELEETLSTLRTSASLIEQASNAVDAWRNSHKSFADAARERRLPESGRLAAIAVRIRMLAEELKKGN